MEGEEGRAKGGRLTWRTCEQSAKTALLQTVLMSMATLLVAEAWLVALADCAVGSAEGVTTRSNPKPSEAIISHPKRYKAIGSNRKRSQGDQKRYKAIGSNRKQSQGDQKAISPAP